MWEGDSQGPSFSIAVISNKLVVGSEPTSLLVKANFHFLLLFFLKRGFLKSSSGGTDFSLTADEFSLMIRECCVLWDLILVNMHNLDVYSKHSNLISLWDGYDSYKKVDKLLMVEEQSGCTEFNELNFNSTFKWFRAIRFRSQIAYGTIRWLLLLSSLSSSISLALSSFQLDSKLSRAGTISCVILCNSLYLWCKLEQLSAVAKETTAGKNRCCVF